MNGCLALTGCGLRLDTEHNAIQLESSGALMAKAAGVHILPRTFSQFI
ncbi:MAG: hypothetical protein ABW185_12470 [Sedimenticola sp.]